jgi:large subunit ribosomal protein L13
MQAMNTYSAKPTDVDRKWFLVDAEDLVLGRLAVVVANRLRGKHKPMFTPHIDCGDNVVIVNAEKVRLTGNKRADKVYYWHTGYPGGIKSRTAEAILDGDHPERVLKKAVQRMLPKTKLGRQQLTKLKIYAGPDHPHEAQSPVVLDVAAMNSKNRRSAR